jgi:hypothetical protein
MIAFGQQFLGKTGDIRLEVSIRPSILELGDTAWANAIRFRKVTIQDFKRLFCFHLLEQGAKASADVIDATAIIADHEIKIIRVFVLTPLIKSQCFQHDECTRATHPNFAVRLFTRQCETFQRNLLFILKGQVKAWCYDRGKIFFDMA